MLRVNRQSRTDRQIIAAITRYVTECFAKETTPSIGELTGRLGISRTRITRATRRHTGLTTITYIRTLQVKRAKQLIDAGVPLTRVAYAAGFGTRRTFFRVFKHVTGITPDCYRRTK